jgi:hypothetical protein
MKLEESFLRQKRQNYSLQTVFRNVNKYMLHFDEPSPVKMARIFWMANYGIRLTDIEKFWDLN